jgi:hypothetical protein
MGFTIYWSQIPGSEERFKAFAQKAMSLITQGVTYEYTQNAFTIFADDRTSEDFYVKRSNEGFHYCRTDRKPYTSDILMCLILMVEHGLAKNVMSDGDQGYMETLKKVNAKFPLATYESQAEHFTRLINMFKD